MDVSGFRNASIDALAHAAPQLQSLALIKCPWLTNSCVQHFNGFRCVVAWPLQGLWRVAADAFIVRMHSVVSSIRQPASCRELQNLHLENNHHLTVAGLVRLAPLTSLRTLKLRMCQLIGALEVRQLIEDLPAVEQVNDRASGVL